MRKLNLHLPATKEELYAKSRNALTSAVQETRRIFNENTPNYLMSASASATFALLSLLSKVEGDDTFTAMLALLACGATGTLAVQQYGTDKTLRLLYSACPTLFSRLAVTNAPKNTLNKNQKENENKAEPVAANLGKKNQ